MSPSIVNERTNDNYWSPRYRTSYNRFFVAVHRFVSAKLRSSQQNYEPRFIATLLHRIPVIHWLILCSQPLSVVVTRILFNNHHEQKCTKWEIRGGEYEEEEPLLIAACLVDNCLGSNCGNKFANQIVRFAFAFSFPAVVVQFNCILIT